MKQIQKDSLFNEYKGNLFEFLVAQKLAAKLKIEGAFLASLDSDFFSILQQQEAYLAEEFPEWKDSLIEFSEKTSQKIFEEINDEVREIFLIGKKAAASGDTRFFECDILLRSSDKEIPISLKLSKSGAYVNTKSAGLKSFLSKYFEKTNGMKAQKELDEFVLFEFENLARSLHQEEGIEYSSGFKNWQQNHLPIRPGELSESSRQRLHEYYHKLNAKLYSLMAQMETLAPQDFSQCLSPLMGAGSCDMLQITCYYKMYKEKPILDSIENESLRESGGRAEFLELNPAIGNFTLKWEKKWLQIRIKPMKTFIQPSFKVNCSVKTIQ